MLLWSKCSRAWCSRCSRWSSRWSSSLRWRRLCWPGWPGRGTGVAVGLGFARFGEALSGRIWPACRSACRPRSWPAGFALFLGTWAAIASPRAPLAAPTDRRGVPLPIAVPSVAIGLGRDRVHAGPLLLGGTRWIVILAHFVPVLAFAFSAVRRHWTASTRCTAGRRIRGPGRPVLLRITLPLLLPALVRPPAWRSRCRWASWAPPSWRIPPRGDVAGDHLRAHGPRSGLPGGGQHHGAALATPSALSSSAGSAAGPRCASFVRRRVWLRTRSHGPSLGRRRCMRRRRTGRTRSCCILKVVTLVAAVAMAGASGRRRGGTDALLRRPQGRRRGEACQIQESDPAYQVNIGFPSDYRDLSRSPITSSNPVTGSSTWPRVLPRSTCPMSSTSPLRATSRRSHHITPSPWCCMTYEHRRRASEIRCSRRSTRIGPTARPSPRHVPAAGQRPAQSRLPDRGDRVAEQTGQPIFVDPIAGMGPGQLSGLRHHRRWGHALLQPGRPLPELAGATQVLVPRAPTPPAPGVSSPAG